ncbi:MAG: thylakoid membrane photosystem I accumulation factor [Synechococcus sp.]|nr:thylakoid membrane photosystem I accumulation factor [Synechococcus sp.]
MARLLCSLVGLLFAVILLAAPVQASLTSDSYDGNIYALYAGNGSLVPPATSLRDSQAAGRTTILVFYLDDSSTSKAFAPVVSELQRLWGRAVDLMPLTTDALQGREAEGPGDPATYWHGRIPQVVVLDGKGAILLDEEGQVSLDAINKAVSKATGIAGPEGVTTSVSFNELNTEVQTR